MIIISSITQPRASCAAVMIVRDAEITIRRCLDSLLKSGCIDEVIIALDARTIDGTPAILRAYASQYPVKVIWHQWVKEDYAAARNVSISAARTDYLFWIDSDEYLMNGKALCDVLRNPKGKAYYAHQLSRKSNGEVFSLPQIRLFPRLPGVYFELPVHEQVIFSLRRIGIPEANSNINIWHTGYESDSWNLEKHQRYLKIMEKWLKENRRNDEKRAYIMQQYNVSKRYARA